MLGAHMAEAHVALDGHSASFAVDAQRSRFEKLSSSMLVVLEKSMQGV